MLASCKDNVVSTAKNSIPFNVWSFSGVKGILFVLVMGHSLPVRLLSPRVLVPHIATPNSFTNIESRVWWFILLHSSLLSFTPCPKWIWQKSKTKVIRVSDCTFAYKSQNTLSLDGRLTNTGAEVLFSSIYLHKYRKNRTKLSIFGGSRNDSKISLRMQMIYKK